VVQGARFVTVKCKEKVKREVSHAQMTCKTNANARLHTRWRIAPWTVKSVFGAGGLLVRKVVVQEFALETARSHSPSTGEGLAPRRTVSITATFLHAQPTVKANGWTGLRARLSVELAIKLAQSRSSQLRKMVVENAHWNRIVYAIRYHAPRLPQHQRPLQPATSPPLSSSLLLHKHSGMVYSLLSWVS